MLSWPREMVDSLENQKVVWNDSEKILLMNTYESVVHISDMSYAYVCKQHREFQMLIKFSKQNF